MTIADATRQLADRALGAARALTNHGETIDDNQVTVERVAYAATEARVIAELAEAPLTLREGADVAAAELAISIRNRLEPLAGVLGFEPAYDAQTRAAIAEHIAPAAV